MCWQKRSGGDHDTVCETEACADWVAGGDWLTWRQAKRPWRKAGSIRKRRHWPSRSRPASCRPSMPACRRTRWWCRWSRRSASMAACGAGRSSGRPTPTTTCASSTTRCSASRPTAPRSSRRSPRQQSPRPTSRPGRSSCARARSGRTASPSRADDILFWYNDVLLNKELTPTLPGWIKNPDGSAAKVEKVDDDTRCASPMPHRRRCSSPPSPMPGRRRPHLSRCSCRRITSRSSIPTTRPRPTSRRWRRRRASRRGPNCSPTRTPRRKIRSGRPWRPGRRPAAPAIRSSR